LHFSTAPCAATFAWRRVNGAVRRGILPSIDHSRKAA
jgi:hypothetical protein